MRSLIILTFFVLLATFLSAIIFSGPVFAVNENALPEGVEKAIVVDIIDGDTMDVEIVSSRRIERVRMIGIDTPETNYSYDNEPECYGVEASSYAESILEDEQEIWLEQDDDPTDNYDRLLGYIWFISAENSELYMMNLVLVDGGYAEAKRYEPNTLHQGELDQAEETARDASRGLWAGCTSNGNPNDPPENGVISFSDGAETSSNGTGQNEQDNTAAVRNEDYACSFFATAADAQEFMTSFPDMRADLDPDGNGKACDNSDVFS